MTTAQPQGAQHPVAGRLWRALAYLYIAFAVVSTLMYARTAFLAPETYGGVASASLGATLIRTSDPGRIDVVVRGLHRPSPLADAGVREGDRLRMDIPWNDFRALRTGERFGFTRVSPGPAQHMSLVVPEFEGHSKDVGNYRFLITLFNLAAGLLLFFRLRGDFGAEALGMAFVVTTITSNFPSPPVWSIFWVTVAYSGVALAPFLILAFAMAFYNRYSRPIGAGEKVAYGVSVAVIAAAFVVGFFSNYLAYASPLIQANVGVIFVAEVAAYGATIFYFARGYATATGGVRARYLFLLIALLLTFCLTAVQTYSFLVLKLARMDPENPLYDVNVVLSLLGPLLFAYAVLRHRVVDLGFVLNRTLVYGAISILLLSAFGLIEWAVDHVLKPAGRGESAVLDASIAVGVYLTFHRVRDVVESRLEALFFRRWHDNERRLRRLAAEAGFITQPGKLRTAFLDELRRFTGGATVGLYLQDATAYRAAESVDTLPETIDTDEAALVAMRAERSEIHLAETASPLPAALALPMLQRSVLLGFVLLGPKPGGDSYRPDEIAALCHATHQIGLDLHALRIDQLEVDSQRMTQAIHKLKFENAVLRRARRSGA